MCPGQASWPGNNRLPWACGTAGVRLQGETFARCAGVFLIAGQPSVCRPLPRLRKLQALAEMRPKLKRTVVGIWIANEENSSVRCFTCDCAYKEQTCIDCVVCKCMQHNHQHAGDSSFVAELKLSLLVQINVMSGIHRSFGK
eukprot:365274-Chlamydomonas_euryale.AAC.16